MINVLQAGVGPLGQKVATYALQRIGINITGAVDPDPRKAGKDLGALCGGEPLGVTVRETLDEALEDTKADIAIVTTLSSLERIESQITAIAEAGLNMVSTCEELSYPWQSKPQIAKRIDEVCQKYGVTCLGTGVNPGFLMDYLPAVLTSVCQKVEHVKVTRVQDASVRRIPFQQKIGAGLNDREFQNKKQEGTLRHVGLAESIHMIAGALRWDLDRVEETLEPVVANQKEGAGYTLIENGHARGVEQVGTGFIGDEPKITLHFKAAVGEEQSYDKIEIDGTPSFTSRIEGGVNGDIATSAITVNALAAVMKSAPGLKTMLDIPVPACFSKI
jgi:4-hydroxy-tetrahydrodipicolinate reductase